MRFQTKSNISNQNKLIIYFLLLFVSISVSIGFIYIFANRSLQTFSYGAITNEISISPIPKTKNILSKSKLGIFFLDATEEGKKLIEAGPRVIKVLDPQNNPKLMDLVRNYKRMYPDGIVIMRIYERTKNFKYLGPPYDIESEKAKEYWESVLQPEIEKIAPEDRKLFDYLSATNEGDNTPLPDTRDNAYWLSQFWSYLIDYISSSGIKPLIGEINVGILNPSDAIPQMNNSLTKLLDVHGIWSYHAYTIKYTQDVVQELETSLRYRQFYDYFNKNYPNLSSLPMVLGEAGVDLSGGGETSGWQARGDDKRYKCWLIWFDGELQKDPQIIGATLFQIGNYDKWPSFNLDPIVSWLSDYIKGGNNLDNCQNPNHSNNP